MRFITFFLSCLCLQAYSQDFVITTKSDTLKGTIKLVYMDKLDQVQVTINKKKTNYQATKIRAVHLNNEIYHPVGFQTTIRFMKLLKPGYLRLYAFRLDNQLTFDGKYLLKSDGIGMEVPNLGFKKRIAEFLSDYPKLAERIENGDLGKEQLDTIIDEYNQHIVDNTKTEMAIVVETKVAKTRSVYLDDLRKSIEAQPEFSSRKNALALIQDIDGKLQSLQEIPGYMIDTLKGYLSGVDAVQGEFNKFVDSLKN